MAEVQTTGATDAPSLAIVKEPVRSDSAKQGAPSAGPDVLQGQPAPGGQNQARATDTSTGGPGASGSQEGRGMPRACKVEEAQKGAIDGRGEKIDRVFHRRANYAIYLAHGAVVVQFSDEPALADKQIEAIAELLPFRNKLQYLGRGLTEKSKHPEEACYFTQIADAFRLGLENKVDSGRSILQGAIEDATALLEREGRIGYLAVGLVTMASFLTISVVGAVLGSAYGPDALAKMFAAAGSGALGAMLSIAMGIRNRTVAIDGYSSGNKTEAILRVLIGVISGLVLYLMISSGLVKGVDSMLPKDATATAAAWTVTMLIGFLGGFVERVVPDLLDKTGSRITAGVTSAGSTKTVP